VPWGWGKIPAAAHPVADQDAVLTAALAHSETQLLAQISDEAGLDGRSMGVLGFNGALIVADIAAKALLHFWWWSPLPFVGVSIFLVAKPILGEETYLGPEALTFYATYGGQTARAAREQLLADLDRSFQANSRRAGAKATALTRALATIGAGFLVAGVLILGVGSNRVGSYVCPYASQATRSTDAGACPGALGTAAGWAARRYQIAPPPVH
jgi:hypothetical protein